MFNKYKKSTKKKLPKYEDGTIVPQDVNMSRYSDADRAALQGSGTDQDYMNSRRTQGTTQNFNYGAAAGVLTGAANNIGSTYNNPYSTDTQKGNSIYDSGKSAIGLIPGFGTAIQGGMNLGDAIGAPIKNDAERIGVDGKLSNRNGSTIAHTAGVLFNPAKSLSNTMSDSSASGGQKVAAALTGGISDVFFAKHYNNKLEKDYANTHEIDPNNGTRMFAAGGMNIQPNAEVEKQENTLNPDGSTTQFDGNSHEMGGIPTQLDPGTLIFSDKLKHQGKTFAKLNMANNTSKEDKILKDNKADTRTKQTAALMKQAKIGNSLSLFKIQEELKQSKFDNYQKRLGGIMKYSTGGPYDPENPNSPEQMQPINTGFVQGFNQTLPNAPNYNPSQYGMGKYDPASQELKGVNKTQPDYKSSYAPGILGPNDSGNTPDNPYVRKTNTGLTNEELYNRDLEAANNRNESGGSRNNWSDALYNAGFGLAQNAGELSYLAEQGKRHDTQKLYDYNPALLDPTASLRYNNQQGRVAAENLKNASNGSAGTYLSNRGALATQQMLANDNIRQQYANQNAQIQNQGQQYNIGNKYRTDEINAQNKAVAENNYYKAIERMGINTASQLKDNKMSKTDLEHASMFREMYDNPEYTKYMDKYLESKGYKKSKG